MPIVRKSDAKKQIKDLETCIEKLKNILEGEPPNDNVWNFYSLSERDYVRDFVEVNQAELNIALAEVDARIKELKRAKTLKAERLHK